jgi:hypothetical protein
MSRLQQSRTGRRIAPRKEMNAAELKRAVDATLAERGLVSPRWNSDRKPQSSAGGGGR